jgi:hypothetical protein
VLNRLTLSSLFLFWAVMMVLLWRAEFGKELRGSLPAETVVDRVLRSPDDSSMILYHRGQRIGSMVWAPNVGQEVVTGKINTLEESPEGQVAQISEYTIDAEGTVYPGDDRKPLKYDVRLTLSTNRDWRDLTVRITQRPDTWSIRADAKEKQLTLNHSSDGEAWERKFAFDDLRRPEKILAELGMPWATVMLAGGLGLSPQQATVESLSLGLKWEASLGFVPLGKSSVRCYRLSARLFDRFEVVVFVSRLGELLRVELPDGYLLVNERWTNL